MAELNYTEKKQFEKRLANFATLARAIDLTPTTVYFDERWDKLKKKLGIPDLEAFLIKDIEEMVKKELYRDLYAVKLEELSDKELKPLMNSIFGSVVWT